MAAPISNDLAALIKSIVYENREFDVSSLSQGVQEKRFSLLDVVESLRPYLTSTETQSRADGTKILSSLLELLPTDYLSSKEVTVLVIFICDRLKDHHSVIPHVVAAADSLIRSNAASASDIIQTVSSIFKEVHVQSLTQAERRHVYKMVEYLLDHRLEAIQAMGSDFVFGYIQCMDGERDPRNLLIAFNCVTVIAKNLNLGPFVEDLFDVVSCYFPIDFTPPSNDPFGITKDQLVLSLRRCLSSTSQFAEFCLPLIQEKMTSSVQNAKLQALLTLADCSSTFGEKLLEYSGSLWSSIRREVFAPVSDAVEQAALKALVAMTTALSKLVVPPGGSSLLDAFVLDILQDVSRHLCEPEEKLVTPSGRILQAVGSASSPACCIVLQKVIPLLLDQIEQHKQVQDCKVLLNQLIDFLKLASNWQDPGSNPLLPNKDKLFMLFVSMLSHSSHSLCELGIHGLMALVGIYGMLDKDEIQLCGQHILQVVYILEKSTRKTAVSALAMLCPQLQSDTINSICTQLKEHADENSDLCLEVMSQISCCLDVIKHVVPYYLQCLDNVRQKDDTLDKVTTVISYLYSVIDKNKHSKQCINYMHEVSTQRLFRLCLLGALDSNSVYSQLAVVERLTSCLRIIVCHLDESKSQQVLQSTIVLFLSNDVTDFRHMLPQELDLSEFHPFSVHAPVSQSQLIYLFTAVVCSQPLNVPIPQQTEILTNLLDLATRWRHLPSANAAAKCFAGLVNKLSDDVPGPSVRKLTGELITSPEFQQRAVLVLIWLTKAMLMRNHPDQKPLINALLGLLSDANLGIQVGQGFRILLEDMEDILTEEMHACIKFMYKQRLFVFTVDALIEGFTKAEKDSHLPYLIAVSYLLKYVPRDALTSYLHTLIPLMIQCLHHDGEELWLSTLSTLDNMLQKSPDLLTNYVDELVSYLLKLTEYKPNMEVRIASLRCLFSLASLPLTILVPHQRAVIKKLLPVLDDHKRLVRRQAVLTREKWILIGAPGTE